jgi:hypothetical protein
MMRVNTKNREMAVAFGGKDIPFELIRRNVKRLTITVHPDKQVTVVAPSDKSIDDIFIRVKKRAPWIAKQLDYFEQFQPLPLERKYVSGETHFYLGRQYRLKVIKDKSEAVKLIGRFIRAHVRDRGDTKRVRELLDNWYLDHARMIFRKHLDKRLGMARSLNVNVPNIIIRRLAKRWGSCTKSGNIVLNTDLVKTPLYCIEYVIMHELCHLRVPKHNQQFFRLMFRYMPDWQKRKARLDMFII